MFGNPDPEIRLGIGICPTLISMDLLERTSELCVILYHMHLHGGVCADDRSRLANASFCQAEL